jgi:hypothetical protein
VAGSCEHGNELLGSMKGEGFLDYWLFKEGSAMWS